MLHSKNKIMVWKTSALNGQVCGIGYITGQSTVPKFGKQIDTIKFICNYFRELPALQKLNVM